MYFFIAVLISDYVIHRIVFEVDGVVVEVIDGSNSTQQVQLSVLVYIVGVGNLHALSQSVVAVFGYGIVRGLYMNDVFTFVVAYLCL